MAQHTIIENIHRNTEDWLATKAAVRAKGVDCPDSTPTAQVAGKIAEIETGITPTGTLNITENGTYDVTEYAQVNFDDKYLRAMITGDVANLVLKVPTGTTEIRKYGFAYLGSIGVTDLDVDLTNYRGWHLPESCFQGSSLINFDLSKSNTITTIEATCFRECWSLRVANLINGSLSSIRTSAFEDCSFLQTVYLGDTVGTIGNKAFYNTGLTDIYYTGSQSDWNNITIGTDTFPQGVTIHYDYVPST